MFIVNGHKGLGMDWMNLRCFFGWEDHEDGEVEENEENDGA